MYICYNKFQSFPHTHRKDGCKHKGLDLGGFHVGESELTKEGC